MFIYEELQIWFCFFIKALKKRLNLNKEPIKFKHFFIIKIEQIVSMNGFYAARILQYPQKFVSILRFADKLIHTRKNLQDLGQKTLILFDNFFEQFPEIFYNKFPNLYPNLIGRLIFIQGTVVNEGSLLIKRYKRKLIKNQKNKHTICKPNFLSQKKNIFDEDFLTKPENRYSGIEIQNIKMITKCEKFYTENEFEYNLTDISLIGKMASLGKTGKNITLWGIIKRKAEIFSKFKKQLYSKLFIEAISIFFEKKEPFFKKKLWKPESPMINFLLLSQDTKIKGGDRFFIKKLFARFLSKQFSENFKIFILYSLLGGGVEKNFFKVDRDSINLCLVQNFFSAHFNLFYQIRKFFKKTVYLQTNNNENSDYGFYGQRLSFFSKKKKFQQMLNYSLLFFIDYIQFSCKKKSDFLYSLIYKNSPTIFYRGVKYKIKKPFSIIAVIKPIPTFSYFNSKKIYSVLKLQKLFSFFDIVIPVQEYIFIPDNRVIPFFFQIQKTDNKLSGLKFNNFLKGVGSRTFSILNISKYIRFLKSFRKPIFSFSAEKVLILWYLSDIFKNFYPDISIFFLEKLIKFSQANAKIYNRDIILLQDTMFAISILEKLYLKFYISTNLDLITTKLCYKLIEKNDLKLYKRVYDISDFLKPTLRTNTCNSNL